MTVGEYFRRIRTDRRISLRTMAKDLEVTPSMISKVERDKCGIRLRTLKMFCEYLELDLKIMVNDTEFRIK